MTARFLIGDVFDRMADLPDGSFDLITCSPPFLALRSYLPEGHPDKAKEVGSEPTPAVFIDTMLALAAEWRRLLAPHGSIAIELGDTYAGSGGAGGDYGPDGLREGQQAFSGSAAKRRTHGVGNEYRPARSGRAGGWPLPLSLCGIPQAFMLSLIYGYNVLDRRGPDSPAGQWRIRNEKAWIRTNPPVGALGGKERPATSYIAVACVARDRYFDLDAVRTRPTQDPATYTGNGYTKGRPDGVKGNEAMPGNPGGAPPRDWYHTVDAILDTELDTRANGRAKDRSDEGPQQYTPNGQPTHQTFRTETTGARGHHLRRALERAGILTTLDAYDVSPKGYAGAHYAVWPPELVRLLVDEMCPRRVCTQCGEPSWRIVKSTLVGQYADNPQWRDVDPRMAFGPSGDTRAVHETVGWSDCGHNTWRPGRILDPFAGSGTTLAVATGMGRDVVGIDIDTRNALLAMERVGMWLEIVWPDPDYTLATLPRASSVAGAYDEWITDETACQLLGAVVNYWHNGTRRSELPTETHHHNGKIRPNLTGQGAMFLEETA